MIVNDVKPVTPKPPIPKFKESERPANIKMVIERIETKLKMAKENLKEANDEYYKCGKENRVRAEGLAYADVRYYQGVVNTCKFVLNLLKEE